MHITDAYNGLAQIGASQGLLLDRDPRLLLTPTTTATPLYKLSNSATGDNTRPSSI